MALEIDIMKQRNKILMVYYIDFNNFVSLCGEIFLLQKCL